MKHLHTFESFLGESLKFNIGSIELAIRYLENETNKTISSNYKWIVDQIKSKIDASSNINSDVELDKQEYDFVKKFSELGAKKYKGLETD